ncbi:flagellin [Phaeovulum sp.]|uniref:flagellin n=1 Tax=Phaeovulum sp. TaxID=2934796 RepID=UPI0039E2EC96
MNYKSIGDMAQTFQMQRHNLQLKTHLSRLTEELTTGVQKDLGVAVRGDFTALAGIERSLTVLNSYAFTTAEASQLADSMQGVLGTMQSLMADTGPMLLSSATSTSPTMVATSTADAKQKFESMIMALNTNTAGRYAFSGTATDMRPLAAPEDILAKLHTTISGASTASDALEAIDMWFDAPTGSGGFVDQAYTGGTTALSAFRISESETAQLPINATDPNIRDAIRGLAIAALVSDGALAGNDTERAHLTRAAGEHVFAAGNKLVATQAAIGATQAQIGQVSTRNTAEASALTLARSGMIAADPYDTATALEAVQTQLETLYTLTARLSRLSLTDYLS